MKNVIVVGNGMVGQRFVEALAARDADGQWRITVLGEENRPAYDRVRLSAFFDGVSASELALGDLPPGVSLRLGEPVRSIDRTRKVVTTDAGEYAYDKLVLATGSRAFVPPIGGAELPGVFVYRTIDDLV
ncbi:MAG: FAD-dependent oxidoreductase, partial [Hamadaea sp.]|nr:FAD-dependent oxidoreductase [Hamadaea sp.]